MQRRHEIEKRIGGRLKNIGSFIILKLSSGMDQEERKNFDKTINAFLQNALMESFLCMMIFSS